MRLYDYIIYRFSLKTKSDFVTVRSHCSGGLLRVQRVKPNLDLLPADDNTIDCAGKRLILRINKELLL
jgi:hypothetical protein